MENRKILWEVVKNKPGAAHGLDHVERVYRLALEIGKKEGADVEVIEISAILHDIERDKNNHAVESARYAKKILLRMSYPEEIIERVVHCIESHSFSSGIKPRTLEAKVLSDADKLDAMGATGIARAFMFAGETGRDIQASLEHFETKLLRLQSMLYTETARKMGRERHRFLEVFYKKLKNELERYQ